MKGNFIDLKTVDKQNNHWGTVRLAFLIKCLYSVQLLLLAFRLFFLGSRPIVVEDCIAGTSVV